MEREYCFHKQEQEQEYEGVEQERKEWRDSRRRRSGRSAGGDQKRYWGFSSWGALHSGAT
jgi:hypothetical protein